MRKTINIDLLIKEYINGKSINQLAKEMKSSYRFLVKNLKQKGIVIRTDKEQQQLDYNNKKHSNLNLLTNNIESNPLFFYILGALKGDGHYMFKRNCIQINVIDKDFLEEIKRIFKIISPKTRVNIIQHTKENGNSKKQWRINLCCKDFFDKKLYLLKPLRLEEKINYLRGLWDAEGSVGLFKRPVKKDNGKIYEGHDKWLTISQKSIMDLEEWSGYLQDLGIECNKQYKDDGRSSIIIRKNEYIRLFNDLIGFKIKRKQERLEEVVAYINKWNIVRKELDKTKIKSIKKIGQRKTYDLETPDYHNFILDNGMISHNSVLAMTVCAYLAMQISETKVDKKVLNLNPYDLDHVFFDNQQMVDLSQKMKQYSIVHYDEGREGLAANKAMRQFQQDLMDFFAECGQLNHIFVIVCPDFFELKENIAVARSECLINVYRKEVPIIKNGIPLVRFSRGHFEFFNKRKKQILFDMAKSMRRKQYNLVKPNFKGSFTNQYALDEEKYKEKKRDSLSRFKARHEEEEKSPKDLTFRNNYIIINKKQGKSDIKVSKELEEYGMELSARQINRIWNNYLLKEGKSLENRHLDGNSAPYTNITTGKGVVSGD